jgi:hypothetical protein
MNYKIVLIVAVMLSPGAIHAQSQEGNPGSKGTIPKAVQDHNRWVMDQKSWGLPNASDVKVAKRAAAQGLAPAQFRLALMYDRGWGVQQSDVKAVKWLRKAAEQDFVEAQYNLGSRYESGEGVTQDHAKAANWFRKAAEQGSVNAQKTWEQCMASVKACQGIILNLMSGRALRQNPVTKAQSLTAILPPINSHLSI